jgi:4-aminobutyrate aminotransferase-like enzyme
MNHSKNEQLMARKAAATPRGVGVMGSFFADRADNAELWDVEGRRFIDFAGGIAVMNTGTPRSSPQFKNSSNASPTPATRSCPTRATSPSPKNSMH